MSAQMLDYLDELGIADDTFVMYSTDNGPHRNTLARRRHDAVPQRKEHQLGRRIPRFRCSCAGPARSKAGSVSNEIVQHHDWLPTFLAMAGEPDVVEKLKKGYKAIGRTYKNHIDGFNLLPYLTGKAKESPRKLFFYFSDDGDMLGHPLRQLEGRVHGAALRTAQCRCGRSPSRACDCRSSSICEPIRTSSPTSRRTPTTIGSFITPTSCMRRRRPPQKFAETFEEFPPVQKPNTFTIDDALAKMRSAAGGD